MSEASRAALSREYRDGTTRLRRMLVDTVTPMFADLGSWRSGDVAGFLDQVLPVTMGAQDAMARLTDTYLSARLADRFGGEVPPLGAEAAQAIRGIDPETVYRRPFAQLWTELGNGTPFPLALQHSTDRLVSIATTDLQLAKTHTSRDVFAAHDGVTHYLRVPRGSDSCALCLIASTQPYTKANLQPIHPGCQCHVRETTDPTEGYDPELLDQVHEAVARDLGPEYRDYSGRDADYRQMVVTRDHGEYGPTLSVSGHRFTGPADIP